MPQQHFLYPFWFIVGLLQDRIEKGDAPGMKLSWRFIRPQLQRTITMQSRFGIVSVQESWRQNWASEDEDDTPNALHSVALAMAQKANVFSSLGAHGDTVF
mmetsp:Transcript_55789/g.88422  ORF Transcript_55789/g.88422 Transcript_55789/m.88422 type:complete len:101 (-) Transcript_55789:3-305(-)